MPPKPPRMGGGANLLDSPKTGNNNDFESPETDEKNEEEYIVTYKTYDDYFTDFDLPSEMSGTTITGNGSLSSPYEINSTNDFIFLTTIWLNQKHIALNCDIILNDEIFDKDGSCNGGDGVVYEWLACERWGSTRFYGNGHKISGVYINQPEKTHLGIFGLVTFALVENLNVENYYISGKQYVYAFNASVLYSVENCCFSKGFCYSEGMTAGISYMVQEAKNVKHYSFLKGQTVSGIAIYSNNNGYFYNVTNYGDLESTCFLCGIVYDAGKSFVFEKVCNYGNLTNISNDVSAQISGIIGNKSIKNTQIVLKECVNYGKVDGGKANYVAGIAGFVDGGDLTIESCANYGEIVAFQHYGVGLLIGRVTCYYDCYTTNVTIKNCTGETTTHEPIIGSIGIGVAPTRKTQINIVDSHFKWRKLKQMPFGLVACNLSFAYTRESQSFLNIKNVRFDVNGVPTGTVNLFYQAEYFLKVNLYNVLIDIKTTYNRTNVDYFVYNYTTGATPMWNIYGIIVKENSTSGTNSYFYGTDFSGFYCDWNTGKIGLKALNGKGFFQGGVNEEWLLAKGFEKKG